MIYPSELVEEVDRGYKSPKIRRTLSIYRKVFGYDPAHIGGYYDSSLLLKFIKFAEIYARIRNKQAVKIIKKLRKELSECRQKRS